MSEGCQQASIYAPGALQGHNNAASTLSGQLANLIGAISGDVNAGIVLPKVVLAHLDRQVGDELTLVLKPNGIELVGGEPDFEEQMAAARKVMAARKRALRELAK